MYVANRRYAIQCSCMFVIKRTIWAQNSIVNLLSTRNRKRNLFVYDVYYGSYLWRYQFFDMNVRMFDGQIEFSELQCFGFFLILRNFFSVGCTCLIASQVYEQGYFLQKKRRLSHRLLYQINQEK